MVHGREWSCTCILILKGWCSFKVSWVTHFVYSFSIMNSHDDFVSVNINMSLHQRHGFREDIIACTNQVNVKDKVIPHNAKHSLIVVFSGLRVKFYDYSGLRIWFDQSLCLWEWENVSFVVEKLESGWLITVIDNVEQSVCGWCELNFTKVDWFTWETYIGSVCLPLCWKVQFIATKNLNAVVCTWKLAHNHWLVGNCYFAWSSW